MRMVWPLLHLARLFQIVSISVSKSVSSLHWDWLTD